MVGGPGGPRSGGRAVGARPLIQGLPGNPSTNTGGIKSWRSFTQEQSSLIDYSLKNDLCVLPTYKWPISPSPTWPTQTETK